MPKPVDRDLPETEVRPDPLVEKRSRRAFTPEYKLRIIAEADQCGHGEIGALLRRENLYSNQLQTWRRQLAEGGEQALSKSAPGPKPKFTAEQREVEKQRVLDACFARTPERFTAGTPRVSLPPSKVQINPLPAAEAEAGATALVNFPTLTRVRQAQDTRCRSTEGS